MTAPLRELLSRHRPLVLVLAAATLVRLAVDVAYWPALFYSGSWSYVRAALGRPFIGMPADRPAGYPIILRILTLDGTAIEPVPIAQHIAGLATGILVYALLLRLGVRRWIATAAAAVVLLEAYTVALEQHVMAEPFATLALVASVYLLVRGRSRPRLLALSGLLLAVAVGIRTATAFAIPAWLVYLIWAERRARPVLAAAGALLVPLLVYSVLHAAVGKGFGMEQAQGWFLYGRVGELVRCEEIDVPRGTEPLCRGPRDEEPDFYVWEPDAPANRLFGGIGEGDAERSNRLLRELAVKTIAARPGAYLELVASDLADALTTTVAVDPPVSLPAGRPPVFGEEDLEHYFPGLRPASRWPAGPARDYHEVARVRGWMLLLPALLALAALALAALRRRSADLRPKETFLLLGVALGMLVGATATVAAIARYVVPTVPFFVAAGALAASVLLGRLKTSA